MDSKNKKQNLREKEIAEAKTKSKILKIPFKDLDKGKISKEVLKEIPEEAAVFYKLVPLKREGDILEVGMVDPDDLKAREALRFIARRNKLKPKIFIITPSDFGNVLKQYRSLGGEVKKALEELEKDLEKVEEIEPEKKKEGKLEEAVKRISVEAPISRIVAVILRYAVEGGASDVHIEPIEEQTKIRFRIDGVLHTSLFLPREIHPAIVSRIKILSRLKIDETRVPQDGRFRTTVAGKKIDFRISTLPVTGGEKVVLRVLDPTAGLKDLPDLGLQGYNLKTLEEAAEQPFGMILISGPTGSGKTTTLYAILSRLNQEGVNIVSLEDPVEYYIGGVNQSQIRPEIGYSFASGLRHILRQDPDVIMVGEIRDEETAALAIHAALTGHILLSTIHTNDAIGVIPRLVDMGIGKFLIPSALNLAVAQRLTRRICPECKKEIEAPPKIAEVIEKELEDLPSQQKEHINYKKPFKIYRAEGCKYCGGKGTKGRIAIFEMLKMTPQLETIINEELTEVKIKEEAKRQGMLTMKQDGILKVLQGIVSFEEVMRVVEE